VLTDLPETRAREEHELALQLTLALALHARKGQAAPEVEQAYLRARELAERLDDTPQLFRVLLGLYRLYGGRMQYQRAGELVEQLYHLAERVQDLDLLLEAHMARGTQLAINFGELVTARDHLGQAIALYDPQHHRTHALRYSIDPGVTSYSRMSWVLWLLGYPDQALRRSQDTLVLAHELAHPHSLAMALHFAAMLHQFRREAPAAHALAEATVSLATRQGLAQWLAVGTFLRGWAQTVQGQEEDGLAEMRRGLGAFRATGTLLDLPWYLGVLAEVCGRMGRVEEGLSMLVEALALACETYFNAAEVQRLKGVLLLQQSAPDAPEAERCFQQALGLARSQQAKAWELRAAVSLSRLWQREGKRDEAYGLLAPVYNWFTEGFDTADLHEAKTLIEALSSCD
jgi:predicted ATPase